MSDDATIAPAQVLREAASYIRRAADGEGDHYRRAIREPVPDGADWCGEIVGWGPSGAELAAAFERYADALAALLPPR